MRTTGEMLVLYCLTLERNHLKVKKNKVNVKLILSLNFLLLN